MLKQILSLTGFFIFMTGICLDQAVKAADDDLRETTCCYICRSVRPQTNTLSRGRVFLRESQVPLSQDKIMIIYPDPLFYTTKEEKDEASTELDN